MPTVGSLFAGVGGLCGGFDAAGFDLRWQVEIDPAARGVLDYHWPGVAKRRDVRECGAHNLEPVDVLVGGFPCQGCSVAGRRLGLKDRRSGLWWEMHRIVGELRPRWVIFENVPGLLSGYDEVTPDEGVPGGAAGGVAGVEAGGPVRSWWMGSVVRSLADLGYHGASTVFDAQYFGVPQRRRRVFGVFGRDPLDGTPAGRAAQVLALADGVPGHPPAGRAAGPGVAPAVTPGARRASGQRGGELLTVGTLGGTGSGSGHWLGPDEAAAGQVVVGFDPQGGKQDVRAGDTAPTLKAGGESSGQKAMAVAFTELGEGHVTFRETDTASSLRTGGGGGEKTANLVAFGGNDTGGERRVSAALTAKGGSGRMDFETETFVVNAAESCAVRSHARESDVARCLDQTGGFAANQGGTVVVNLMGANRRPDRPEGGLYVEDAADLAKCVDGSGLNPAAAQGGTLVVNSLPAGYGKKSPHGDANEGLVVGQCHGSNVGPMGTLRGGNGNEAGGVPFVAFQQHGSDVGGIGTLRAGRGDVQSGLPFLAFSSKDDGRDAGPTAPTLRAMGHDGSHANAGGQVAIAGTICASGAGTERTGGGGCEDSLLVHQAGDAYKCGTCAHFGHQTEHDTVCPACGAADYENVTIRPTVGPHAGMVFDFDADPQRYVKAEGSDATDQAGPGEVLRALRDAIGEEAFSQWGLGVLALLHPPEVLRPEVHGGGSRREAIDIERLVNDALPRPETGRAGAVRKVQKAGRKGCPPPGPRPHEQLARELGAYLSLVSHPGAQDARLLRDLWRASEGLGVLRQALSAIQEVRRPTGGENQDEGDLFGVSVTGTREGTLRQAPPAYATPTREGGAGVGVVRRLTPL